MINIIALICFVISISDVDPKAELNLKKHGIHQRGARSVLLLSQPDSKDNEPQEEDIKTLVLNVRNVWIFSNQSIFGLFFNIMFDSDYY